MSRAVARDLRRRYGERNRIVRAESGEQALEALRQMKLRGDQVAILLADYRMPGLTGIEFLERAMDVYPSARRVLLTAYADTSAAIDAINIVDLDHYLLKPWDPPEEKLYPVIDDLLKAWQREDRKPVKEAKLIGHRWSAPSAALRDFLARNQVPYRWYSSDTEEGERLLAAAGADGHELPVLITADGEPLITPTNAEVAAKVNLSTIPEHDFYDLIVVGGGPAGLGAAVYGASEGLRTVLVEKFATGGQAGQSSRIENYLGFPDGLSGGQLTDRARRQAVKFGAELLTTVEATSLEVAGPAKKLRLSDGGSINAKSVILATGVSYRQLVGSRLHRDDRRGRLLRRGAHRGRGLQGPGRVRGRRRELGRPVGRLPVAVRPFGDHAGARPLARGVDVVLPHPADRGHPQHQRPRLHRGRRSEWRRAPGAADAQGPGQGHDRNSRCRTAVHLYRSGAGNRLAGWRAGT